MTRHHSRKLMMHDDESSSSSRVGVQLLAHRVGALRWRAHCATGRRRFIFLNIRDKLTVLYDTS
jgi:hypothetical protein